MQKSESIASLAAALAKAQGEMENAGKNSVNPHFRSKYADLAEIINTVRPVLAKHGLSVTQFPSFDGTLAHVETIIAHESGEWMSGTTSSPVQKADPQGIGSATTYLRRYSLAAVCNLAQEDDDANASSKAPKQAAKPMPATVQRPAPAPVQEPMMTDQQRKILMAIYAGAPREDRLADANQIMLQAKPTWQNVASFSELTARAADYLIKQLEAMRQGAA